MTGRAHVRETVASAAQYALLGGFAAVAAGISAQGLTGFARENMGLHGVWPYLLFLSLDGAAGVCAVLLTRRAARAESALAPRLAVWGLIAASSSFNWTHAPHHPGAPYAFGLMPVIAAVLFEFTLHELRLRTAGRMDRAVTALRWLHPAECIRVQMRLAASSELSADAATQRVQVTHAARRLYVLRRALNSQGSAAKPSAVAAHRARFAERRAHAALTRAGFADPAVAAEVLRQVQVLILAPDLARLNYTTADAAQAALASMIIPGPAAVPLPTTEVNPGSPGRHGSAAHDCALADSTGHSGAGQEGNGDGHLTAAATRILTEAHRHGERISQKTLGDQLRREGHRVANHSLRRLMAAAAPPFSVAEHARTGLSPAPPRTPGAAGALPNWPAAVIDGNPVNGDHPVSPAPPPPRHHGHDSPDPPRA
jgi:hypothetical protein